MLFPHYKETKVLYHVIHIMCLKEVLTKGIKREKRNTFSEEKYMDFNRFLDQNRTKNIPLWVRRERAFFASFNFREDIKWHSHSALLAIKVQEEKCWVANENLANEIYDPFVLSNIESFDMAKKFMQLKAGELSQNYWEHSFPFQEYLNRNLKDYDEEVMIFHDIPPKDIQCLMIITDHRTFTPEQWQHHFKDRISSLPPL